MIMTANLDNYSNKILFIDWHESKIYDGKKCLSRLFYDQNFLTQKETSKSWKSVFDREYIIILDKKVNSPLTPNIFHNDWHKIRVVCSKMLNTDLLTFFTNFSKNYYNDHETKNIWYWKVLPRKVISIWKYIWRKICTASLKLIFFLWKLLSFSLPGLHMFQTLSLNKERKKLVC